MADEVIEGYLDRAKVKSDTDFYIAELERAVAAYEKLKASKTGVLPDKPLPDISAATRQAEKDTQNLIKTQDKLTVAAERSALAAAKLATEQAKAGAIQQKSLIEQEKELNRLIALEEKQAAAALKKQVAPSDPTNANIPFTTNLSAIEAENSALEKTGTVVNDLDKAQAEAAISATQFSGALNKSTISSSLAAKEDAALVKARQDLIGANSKTNVQLQGLTLQKSLANRAAKEEAQLALGLLSPYELLSKRYATAALNAKDLAVEFGHNSVQAKAAAKEALALNTQLQTIDKTVGQSQKNVGNYGSAFKSAFGGLRTLANILPGIGLSGLFLAGFEGIKLALDALGVFNDKLFTTAKQREVLNKLQEDAAKNGGKEAASLKILRAEIESTNVPMATRLQGIKDIKEQYPDYFKGLTNEELLTGKVGNAYDLAAAAILRKARANAAATQIEANATKQLALEEKDLLDVAETNDKIRKARARTQVISGGTGGVGGTDVSVTRQGVQRELKRQFDERQSDRKKEHDEIEKENQFLLKFAVEGAKETVKIKDDEGKKKVAITKESTKASLDSEFELFKIAQTRKIKLLDDQVNDEKLSFDKRIALLQQFSTESLALVDAQLKEDLRKNTEKDTALQANLKKAKGTERNNLLIEIKNNETARNVIEAAAANSRLAIFDANEKRFTDITDKENTRRLKIQKEAFDKTIKLIEDEGFARKAQLEKDFAAGSEGLQARFDSGEISQRQFNKRKLDLDFAYGIESLQIEIDTAKKKLAVSALLPIDKAKALADLAKLERQLADATLAHIKKTEAEKLAAIQHTLNTVKDVSTEVFNFIGGLLNANLIAEKNKLKAQQDEAEKKAARDIEIVNASSIAEQDKAAKILIINARLQAQKEQIAQKEKQAEINQAKFAKAVAIFNIILSTTQAVIKAYTEGDPYTRVARAILAAVAGAAQLAVAIATPIPHFRHGKNLDNYDGPGIVNDGSKSEVIQRADGSIEFPQGKNVLTHVGRNDIIHPDKDAWLNAILNAAHRDANTGMKFTPAKNTGNEIASELKKQNKLLTIIANKNEVVIGANNGGMVALHKWGARQVQYVQENTNW